MSTALLITGLLFLLNPNIVVIDIFPDFIGCLILLSQIKKPGRINLSFSESYRYFRTLFLVSLCKLPVSFLYFTVANDRNEVWGLIFSLTFGIIEFIFSTRAFNSFFDGINEIFNSTDRLNEYKDIFSRNTDQRVMTAIFLFVKSFFPVLPELTSLTNSNYGTVTPDGILSVANYRTFFIVTATLVTLIIGIIWVIMLSSYLRKINKRTCFASLIRDRYTEALSHDDQVKETVKSVMNFTAFLIIGLIFSIELKFDGFNYLPHTLSALLILTGIFILSKKYQPAKKVRGVAIAYTAASIAAWSYTYLFIMSFFRDFLNDKSEGLSFSVSGILEIYLRKSFDILYKFIGMCLFSALDAIFFVLLLIFIRKVLLCIITDFTGGTYAPDGHIIGEKAWLSSKKSLDRWLNTFIILGMTSAVSNILQTALMVAMPSWWIIDMVIRIVYICAGLKFVFLLREMINDKYDLKN